jgi:hypothetical protein
MKYAYQAEIGRRTILGTDHPVEVVAYKTDRRRWIVTTICNGIAESKPKGFRTKKDAVAYAKVKEIRRLHSVGE